MKLSDMHVHSEYSWDCNVKIEDIIKKLINSNVYYVGICDHIEFNVEKIDFILDKFKMRNLQIDELNQKYDGKIKILKGAEISSPHLYRDLVPELNYLDLDYMMGSIHKIDRKAQTPEEKKLGSYNYYKEVLEMVKANQVDIIGHLDYINRYYGYDYSDRYMIDEILAIINDNDQIIEINTSASRRTNGLYSSFPNSEKLEMYVKLRKEITIGTDAHKLNELNYMLEKQTHIVENLELEPVVFEKRKMLKI